MNIRFYVQDIPVIKHVTTVFTTGRNNVSSINESWLDTDQFTIHFLKFASSLGFNLLEGDYFVTTDKTCMVQDIQFIKMQLIGKVNTKTVITKAIECATEDKRRWGEIEIPLINCNTNKDAIEREQEDAKEMLQVLEQAWIENQNTQLELIVRLTNDQELAFSMFMNSQFHCLGMWDNQHGFMPYQITRS